MHFDIEGTKHEKVVIVVLSYILGFTAGFIAFGLTSHYQTSTNIETEIALIDPIEAIASEEPGLDTVPTESDLNELPADVSPGDAAAVRAFYTDGRLQAVVGESEFLLSVQSKSIDESTAAEFANQGMHEAIPFYLTSPDGAFIYFCEQQTADDTCQHLVFDTTNSMIHYVKADTAKLVTAGDVAKSAAWDGNTLKIGTYRSTSDDAPWEVSPQ